MYTFQASGEMADDMLRSLIETGAKTYDQLANGLAIDKSKVIEYVEYINEQIEPRLIHIDDYGIVSACDYQEVGSFLNNGGFEKVLFYERLYKGIYRKGSQTKNEIIWFNNLYDQGLIDKIDNSSKSGEDIEFKFNQRGINRYEAYHAGLEKEDNRFRQAEIPFHIVGDYIVGDKVEGIKSVGDGNKNAITKDNASSVENAPQKPKPFWKELWGQLIIGCVLIFIAWLFGCNH